MEDLKSHTATHHADTTVTGFLAADVSIFGVAAGSTASLTCLVVRNSSTLTGALMSLHDSGRACRGSAAAADCAAAAAWFRDCESDGGAPAADDGSLGMQSVAVDDGRCRVFASSQGGRISRAPHVWNIAEQRMVHSTPVSPTCGSAYCSAGGAPSVLDGASSGQLFLSPGDAAFAKIREQSGAGTRDPAAPAPAQPLQQGVVARRVRGANRGVVLYALLPGVGLLVLLAIAAYHTCTRADGPSQPVWYSHVE